MKKTLISVIRRTCGCCPHGCVCLTHQTNDKPRSICERHQLQIITDARAYFSRGGRNAEALALVLYEQHPHAPLGEITRLVNAAKES